MRWYVELGYAVNPFETDPLRTDTELIGYENEVDKLLYLVDSGSTILIEGPSGSGKTMLLKEIILNFGGKGRVIYVDGKKINKRIDIEDLLLKNQGAFRRMRGKKPKGMILLLDNAIALPKKTYERLQYYFDQDYLKSVVFATDDHKKLEFPGSLFDRIGPRVFYTVPLAKEDAIEMALSRMGDDDVLTRQNLEKLYDHSKGNIKLFLAGCEAAARYLMENELESLKDKDIEKSLASGNLKDEDAEEPDTNHCLDCGGELKLIGGHYRCERCDLFCPECGVLIDEDDEECPNCKTRFEGEE